MIIGDGLEFLFLKHLWWALDPIMRKTKVLNGQKSILLLMLCRSVRCYGLEDHVEFEDFPQQLKINYGQISQKLFQFMQINQNANQLRSFFKEKFKTKFSSLTSLNVSKFKFKNCLPSP